MAAPGHVVGFVVTIAAIKQVRAVMPKVCVTLPAHLRVTIAPGAISAGHGRLCWAAHSLVSGAPKTFRFSARLALPPRGGAMSLTVHAKLTGTNFAVNRAAAIVQVPPRTVVACPASAAPDPLARIAC